MITTDDLKEAFMKLGVKISESEIEAIIKEHDTGGDNAITFSEFKHMMSEWDL